MYFSVLVKWGGVCWGLGCVWVIGRAMVFFFGGGVKFCSNYRPFGGSNPSRKIVKKNNFPHLWFSQKKKLRNFLVEKLPIFSFRHILKDVFKTLLWGPETVRKKYRVGSEIFPKRVFFLFSGKKVAKFFYWKNFRLFQFGTFQKMSSRLFCGDQKQSGKNIE